MSWVQLLKIAATILEIVSRFLRKQEQVQHDQDIKDIKADPASWGAEHFNGELPSDLPDNADQAGQATTSQLDKDA